MYSFNRVAASSHYQNMHGSMGMGQKLKQHQSTKKKESNINHHNDEEYHNPPWKNPVWNSPAANVRCGKIRKEFAPFPQHCGYCKHFNPQPIPCAEKEASCAQIIIIKKLVALRSEKRFNYVFYFLIIFSLRGKKIKRSHSTKNLVRNGLRKVLQC